MPSQPKDPIYLFHEPLNDTRFAESQIPRTPPKPAREANPRRFSEAFGQRRVDTEGRIERLGKVSGIRGGTPRGKSCGARLPASTPTLHEVTPAPLAAPATGWEGPAHAGRRPYT